MPIADVIIARGFKSLGSQVSNGIQKKYSRYFKKPTTATWMFLLLQKKKKRKATSKAIPWSNSKVQLFLSCMEDKGKRELHEDTRN